MKTTKRLNFFLPVLLMLCTIPSHLQATHLAGLQLTYTHLSGLDYRISLTWYRDCSSTFPAPALIPINVSSSSCGMNQLLPLYMDTSQTKVITHICPYASANCVGGTAPAFEKFVYENDIMLTGQCSDWQFDVSASGRNNAITILVNPGGDDIYVVAHLNNSNFENNSPQFTNDPIIFVCLDQDFHYNHGIYDPDGDSISYEMVVPRTAANTPCVYQPGYGVNNPCSSTPPVSFNDFTGDFLMHSVAPEVGVLAFEIKDWRNGVLMGSVVRDVMIYTMPCGANYPTATGMNGTTQQFLYVFPDDTVCFDVLSDDIDMNDTVTMTWNQTIPNATFVTNGIPHPTGTFCWTPTIGDVRSQPYMFTVMVQDNACSLNNACIYSYFIYVTLDSSLVFLNASELSPHSDLSIFPNPSDGVFMLKQAENISSVKIFDYSGKIIQTSKPQEKRVFLNAPAGVYWIEIIYDDGKMEKQKLLIKK